MTTWLFLFIALYDFRANQQIYEEFGKMNLLYYIHRSMKKEKQITKYRQMGSRNKKTGKLNYYIVTREDHKKFKCECLGFQYKAYQDCKHIKRLKYLLCIEGPEGGSIKVGDKIEYKIYYSAGFESNYKKTSSTTNGVVTQLLKSGYKVESDSGSRTISIVKKSDIINQQ